jgi:hypothetical protein
MKRTTLLFACVLALFVFSCNNSSTVETGNADTQQSRVSRADTQTKSGQMSNVTFNPGDNGKWLVNITDDLARDMLHYYHTKRVMRIKDDKDIKHKIKDKLDTRYMWMDTTDLKNLVTLARNAGGNGIRFYFAVYPKLKEGDYEEGDQERMEKILNKQTIVLVPTTPKKLSSGEDYNADVRNSGPAKGNKSYIYSIKSYNHGELCPPPNPCVGDSLAQDATRSTYSPSRTYN